MLLAFVACYAATVSLPHDPELRYLSFKDTIFARTAWIYDRIHHDPAPIDVVFLGSSRTEAGIRPTMVEAALARHGENLRVVNFALPATGFDIRETLAEEVLRTKRVKLLVVDLTEKFPRDGHQAFGDLATAGQILHAPWLLNRNLPRNLLRLPVRQIDLALATLDPAANGYRARFDPARYEGTTIDPAHAGATAAELAALDSPLHALTLEAQSEQRYREITPPILPASLGWVEFGVSETYIARLADTARRHGVKIVFLYVPFYKGPAAPIEEQWLTRFGPVWKANFLNAGPQQYRDSGHTSADPQTKAMMSDWVAGHIAQTLAAPKSGG